MNLGTLRRAVLLAGAGVALGLSALSSPAQAQEREDDEGRYYDQGQQGQYGDSSNQNYDNGQSADLNFDQTLSPYGQWVEVNGTRVWQPSAEVVGADFQPYGSGGHWVNTDYGWSFESDYDWGWATFHYGRWAFAPGYGWVWAPGTVWGPAWVDWRFGGGYVGWAPLPIYGFGAYVDVYHPYWCFVGTSYFVQPNVFHYAVPVAQVSTVYATTQPLHTQVSYGGQRWYQGPPAARIQAATGAPVPHASIQPPPAGRIQAVRASPGGFGQAAQNQRGGQAFRGQAGVGTNSGFNRGATSGGFGSGVNRAPANGGNFRGPMTPGSGFHGAPSNNGNVGGGFRGGATSGGGGFHGAPPTGNGGNMGGGFHGAPSSGGFHSPAPSPNGGGFRSPAPSPGPGSSGGGFHAPSPAPRGNGSRGELAPPNYNHPMAFNGGGSRAPSQGRVSPPQSGFGGGRAPAPSFGGSGGNSHPAPSQGFSGGSAHAAPSFGGGGSAPHFSAPSSGGGAHFSAPSGGGGFRGHR